MKVSIKIVKKIILVLQNVSMDFIIINHVNNAEGIVKKVSIKIKFVINIIKIV